MDNDESREQLMKEMGEKWKKEREERDKEEKKLVAQPEETIRQEGYGEMSQIRFAVWSAVAIILFVDIVTIIVSFLAGEMPGTTLFGTNYSLVGPIVIDIFLGIAMLRGKNWARVWMLVRVIGGLILFGIASVTSGDYISLVMQAGICISIFLLLTGTSNRLRIRSSIALFLITYIGGIVWLLLPVTTTTTTSVAVTHTEFTTYSKYGFSFEYPDNFRVTEMGLLENTANDNSGIITVERDAEEVEMFMVAYFNTFQYSLEGGIEGAIAGMKNDEGIKSVETSEIIETTKEGNRMLYQYFTTTATTGEIVKGIIGVIYYDKSQKAFSLMTVNDVIISKQDILEDFMKYLDSFVCY